MLGLISYVSSPGANQRLKMIWQSLIILLVVMFQWVGARQNAQDVIFIETQMVKTAEWVNTNLSPDALLAVHDIGAIGYFTQNPILDLAGLITPEVVPFIRNEAELAEYLDASYAEFLIPFPSWYPQMVKGKELIFEAGDDAFPFMDNMGVYVWK
jgi:hypothetical protein